MTGERRGFHQTRELADHIVVVSGIQVQDCFAAGGRLPMCNWIV
jgi:hypothetical protein